MQMENNKVGHFYTQSFHCSLYIHRKCPTLLLSICIFLFVYDNLKWISFFNYFGHLWYIFLFVCTTFCLCVHPYGYIIFGIGSYIPIYIFEFFCWSKKTNSYFIPRTKEGVFLIYGPSFEIDGKR